MKQSVTRWIMGIVSVLLFLLLAWIVSGVWEDTVDMETVLMDVPLEDFSLRLDRIDAALRTQSNVGKGMALTEAMLEAAVENGVIREERLELSYYRLVYDNADGGYVKTETYRVDAASGTITELLRQSGSGRGIDVCTEPITRGVTTVSLTDYIERALIHAGIPTDTALFAYCHVTRQGVKVTLHDGSAEGTVLHSETFD